MASCKPASGSHQHQSPEASCFVDRTYKTTLTERTVSERVRSPQIVRKSKIFVITRDFISRTTLIWNVPCLSELDGTWCLTARVIRFSVRRADHHSHYLTTNQITYNGSIRGVGFTRGQTPRQSPWQSAHGINIGLHISESPINSPCCLSTKIGQSWIMKTISVYFPVGIDAILSLSMSHGENSFIHSN